LIVPDLPVEEAHELRDLASQRDLSLVLLTTPTSPTERVRHIVELCTGFLYCVSVTGITGTRANLPADLKDQLRRLRELTNLPLCAGFGISTVAQVQLLREVVDGIIIGSAIVRLFENSAGGRGAMVKKVGDLSSDLARALNPT
jgi:tryptophan synthase alpha chain